MIGYVYTIRSHQTEDVYYGSTKQSLACRMAGHRRDYKNWLTHDMNYITSFEILKFEDAYIELVEEVNYENKSVLIAREGFQIRNNNCVNKVVPDRKLREYRDTNKAQIREQKKKYYENNKEAVNKYRIEHLDEIKERKKIYRETHKEQIKEKMRELYLKKKAMTIEAHQTHETIADSLHL